MKEYAPGQIRNVALVGHQHAGKTTLAEAMLFSAGAIERLGRVDDGNSALDTSPEEMERKISIQAAVGHLEVDKHKINIIDTPGYEDFVGEVLSSLDVVESAIVVIRGDGGVEVGTEKVWEYVRARNLPAFFCINRMDKEHASFEEAVGSLRSHFGRKALPLEVPLGEGLSFKGVIDLLLEKAYEYSTDGKGTHKEVPVPAEAKRAVEKWRRELFETVAETDEALMEKYLETESLTTEEVTKGLAAAVTSGEVYPVLCSSAYVNVGTHSLLRRIVDLLPSPQDRTVEAEGGTAIKTDPGAPPVAKVFKNVSESHVGDMLFIRVFQGTLRGGQDVYNATRETGDRLGQLFFIQGKNRVDTQKIPAGDIGAAVKLRNAHVGDTLGEKAHAVKVPQTMYPRPSVSAAIAAASKGDEDKIANGLSRLKEEDPTFDVRVDGEVHQTLVSGQGELHLDVLITRLKKRYAVDVVLSKPRIPYKETIRRSAQAQGKYKKQTGGRGQYGDVWLKLEPLPRGKQFEFVDAVVGGVVPGKFIPAVEKGVLGAMEEGVIAGYHVVDVRATIYDGSYHSVDSSEQAFKVAGSMAFKKAVLEASPVLLEPIMNIEVRVPEEYMGDVMGDLSGRRGKIQGTESQGKTIIVRAQVPQAELDRYSTHLRSMTQGRAGHKREFSHYEEVPHEVAQKIIEEAKAAKEKEQGHH